MTAKAMEVTSLRLLFPYQPPPPPPPPEELPGEETPAPTTAAAHEPLAHAPPNDPPPPVQAVWLLRENDVPDDEIDLYRSPRTITLFPGSRVCLLMTRGDAIPFHS